MKLIILTLAIAVLVPSFALAQAGGSTTNECHVTGTDGAGRQVIQCCGVSSGTPMPPGNAL
jgi:hypothetical protein